ncbi:type II toxin-antitoxin system PemK/MazF family toxin [Streptomyces scabiei]|uniref:type II toxin-antitoxin system PemK/MazF family toxin n=1 Tax=Streptomyces scabiei TaxID=1930 RepID=UPI000765B966|nr:type II toxin-antitoxin system PemK/MazF family toxin [Streptomyces scabiei]MDX2538280.1 type II toxin-antitoxin system PemK/MazF family toxin [Streptomyces scabiei]MDX2800935.1 type II toxin-antitoxin system PemK/MazF family toxin [Streptomyces scabiei]MDX2859770.1 type II toxin-antitoxin system PemK/MazF family toxin [Streptomyces scabiei]MDX3830342.1 type II toxin-antitoxin system PemK/MazF family toxin [Streptomyces scabiei]
MVNIGSVLRGEVWGCALPGPLGPHPVVVLTVNRIAEPLSALTVAVITGTSGPASTHVPIGPDCGVTTYDESYVNCTDLHTVDKPRLRRRLGLLDASEMRTVEDRVRVVLGLA